MALLQPESLLIPAIRSGDRLHNSLIRLHFCFVTNEFATDRTEVGCFTTPEGVDQRILRKEVIQPQVPLRLPCYDLVPIAEFILGAWLLAVTSATSDAPHFRGLTGGVYKAQEHIHRGMLTRDY